MKKLIFVLAMGLVLGLASSASAALITIGDAPSGELNLYQIYQTLYGTGYLSNAALQVMENDSAIASGLYNSNSGKVYFVARMASYSHLIYIDGTSTIIANDSSYGTSFFDSTPSDLLTVPDTIAFGLMADSSSGPDWYSQIGKNSDGKFHFIVLNTPDPNKFLIGLEDMSQGSDWDYNDFVILTEGIYPVPEPATMALLGMGILGLFGLRKKT